MCDYVITNSNDKSLWFRIKSIEKKIEKLGPMCSKGFDWVEWVSLTEDLAMYISQLSIHKNIVKQVLSRYD